MFPPLPVPSDPEKEVSDKLVSILQRHFLLPIHVDRIWPLAGHLHSFYLVQLSNETHLLLKCSPKPTTPLIRHEHIMLDTEARALSLLSHMPCIPQLLHYDPLGDLLGPSFLLRHYIPGSSLEKIDSQLSIQERDSIERSLGLLAKRIAQHTSESFGSLGQVANARGTKSWREGFLILFEGLLRNAEDVFINLPYGEIRYQVHRASPVLDEILTPRLVVIDFGQPSQVLVNESKRLCGISSFRTAVWGDVFMAKIFENPSSSVIDGFGSCHAKTQTGRTRQLLYSCYRAVNDIVLQYYRKSRDTAAENKARRELMTALAKMAAA